MPFNRLYSDFVCTLVTGLVMAHIMSKGPYFDDFLEIPDNANSEVIFCKLPQSLGKSDSNKCPSVEKLFVLLGNGCSFSKKSKEAENLPNTKNDSEEVEMIPIENETEEDFTEDVVKMELRWKTEMDEMIEASEEEEKASSLVDSFVMSFLVGSSFLSLLELYREKIRNSGQAAGTGEGDVSGGRRMSLVDLIVNRHVRRTNSQQHAEALRQGSSGSRPPLLRRSSFPVQLPEARPRHAFHRQQSHPGVMTCSLARRVSMDVGEDDSLSDRRRVRIIRRH